MNIRILPLKEAAWTFSSSNTEIGLAAAIPFAMSTTASHRQLKRWSFIGGIWLRSAEENRKQLFGGPDAVGCEPSRSRRGSSDSL